MSLATNCMLLKVMLLRAEWEAIGYGSNCRIDNAETDLPEPLSPTKATVSPELIEKLAPLTAEIWVSPAPKETSKSFTSNNGTVIRTSFLDQKHP